MARGLATSILTVFLLTGVPGFGQFGIPGVGYPGGGGYPGGRRSPRGMPPPQPAKQASLIVGMLRKIGDKNVVVEADDDKKITTISTGSAKYVNASGGSAKIGDFQPGDHVSVSVNQDSKNVYHAVTMTMVREGSPDEHSVASAATEDLSRSINSASGSSSPGNSSNTNSGDHPVLRRAPSSSGDSGTSAPPTSSPTASSPTTASSPSSDDDHPRLRRAVSNADDTPRAQATAPVGSDTPVAPPQLRRGPPPSLTPSTDAVPVPAVADGRPSLHADDATTSARRMPQKMPETGDPFIDQTREAAFAFSETLPNYVVKQYTTRYATAGSRRGGNSWQALDNVTADVIEENGTEKYKNILVNGKPPLRDVEKTGSWSRGEFSSLMQDVLSPFTNADFHGKRATTIVNRAAFRYEFSVEQPNSHWHIESEAAAYMPAYSGSIWIDKENYRVLRIEMSAERMPSTFTFDQVEWAVDYDYVPIGEGKYLLPVHSETLSCERASSQCSRNVIDFRNYKKFTADTSITFDTDK